jgi:hypothetical protein
MATRVQGVRYNPAQGAFEARVDIDRDGRTFRYPVRIEAPESAPRDWLEAALTRQALRMTDTPPRAARPALSEALSRWLHPIRTRSAVAVRADAPPRPQARLH